MQAVCQALFVRASRARFNEEYKNIRVPVRYIFKTKIKLKDLNYGHANMVSLITVHILPLRFCL